MDRARLTFVLKDRYCWVSLESHSREENYSRQEVIFKGRIKGRITLHGFGHRETTDDR
jgi:hypothetical protein